MDKDTKKSTLKKQIIKIKGETIEEVDDFLAVEDPLEISLSILDASPKVTHKNISITMRTPGSDKELALGFLFTEGIASSKQQVAKVDTTPNTTHVFLNTSEKLNLSSLDRHFYTSSSCGVCGKASLDAIKTVCRLPSTPGSFQIEPHAIKTFPSILKQKQAIFKNTGGLHAAAIFNTNGTFICLKEDVGRHNALDKLIGHFFLKDQLPLDQHLLLLSGRASFELIQKAAMAGIHFIMAVGAPSSLAVEMAKEHHITLIGFLNESRYNIYSGADRIKL
ncbi:FdhD protein [Arenibacter nanhaiticus]|uniref:Sulfur carrier protein FdhD n=1 Tax=Arenibacter nanhaiticus TaxID=558155 RepID=A0A1M6K488_9FLAO|nr:formate dehydrogenase accessory sulfurtransferase FdhD [Arenibacter nanhaiticus]SHJ53748.1 FdhD protein [Arenibacter nanhaiticus]